MTLQKFLKSNPICKKTLLKIKQFENKDFPLSLCYERVLYFINPERKVKDESKDK